MKLSDISNLVWFNGWAQFKAKKGQDFNSLLQSHHLNSDFEKSTEKILI